MIAVRVENLNFSFPANWLASKYDDWSYYRNQFSRQGNHIKATDIVALSPEREAYFIEVKDYRHPDTIKPSELPEAIAKKVLFTLAAMLPAKLHANEPAEKQIATQVLNCISLTIVVHIEQPQNHQPVVDLADVKQKLASLLKAVDKHPKIVSMTKMHGLSWSVT